ncbi:MAG: hypothetical protein N2652_08300 [Kiritimatiellae bacterium]|nr:hypothetical protein [Kiritimatiellia bacterium]
MWRRVARFVAALALVPLAATTLQSLVELVADIVRMPGGRLSAAALAAGALAGSAARAQLSTPLRIEILAHELTHVLWTWLFGGRASHLRVGRGGGSVRVSRDNIWVSLSPYVFPIGAMIVLLTWALAALVLRITPPRNAGLALLGAAWGAHLVFSVSLLRVRQPDLEAHGHLLSLLLIVVANLFGAGLALAVVSDLGARAWCLRWARDLALAVRALITFVSGE